MTKVQIATNIQKPTIFERTQQKTNMRRTTQVPTKICELRDVRWQLIRTQKLQTILRSKEQPKE